MTCKTQSLQFNQNTNVVINSIPPVKRMPANKPDVEHGTELDRFRTEHRRQGEEGKMP